MSPGYGAIQIYYYYYYYYYLFLLANICMHLVLEILLGNVLCSPKVPEGGATYPEKLKTFHFCHVIVRTEPYAHRSLAMRVCEHVTM